MRSLLMGGQPCVLGGGAEWSRDTDIMVEADAANLARLQAAIDELRAEPDLVTATMSLRFHG